MLYCFVLRCLWRKIYSYASMKFFFRSVILHEIYPFVVFFLFCPALFCSLSIPFDLILVILSCFVSHPASDRELQSSVVFTEGFVRISRISVSVPLGKTTRLDLPLVKLRVTRGLLCLPPPSQPSLPRPDPRLSSPNILAYPDPYPDPDPC